MQYFLEVVDHQMLLVYKVSFCAKWVECVHWNENVILTTYGTTIGDNDVNVTLSFQWLIVNYTVFSW